MEKYAAGNSRDMNEMKLPNAKAFTEKIVSSNGTQLGLIDGDTGTSIVLYLLSKVCKKKLFSRQARNFLEAISENSESITRLNFEAGFVGIGWAIEWLIQHGFIDDIDSDEILVSIDQELYKTISFSKQKDCTLFTGTLGYIKYFEKRLLNKNVGLNRYTTLGNLEAFVFLTDDLESNVINDQNKLNESLITKGDLSIRDLGIMLITCSSAMHLNVNALVLETILYEGVMYTIKILSEFVSFAKSKMQENKHLLHDYLNLSVMFLIAGKNYRHDVWVESAVKYINILLCSVLSVKTMNTELLFKRLSALCLLYTIEPNSEYKSAALKCIKNLTSKNLPFSIHRGTGKLALAEISLEKPDLLQDWQELFLLT